MKVSLSKGEKMFMVSLFALDLINKSCTVLKILLPWKNCEGTFVLTEQKVPRSIMILVK